jgi:nitrite reductase/ring-hydroxylating ferredoxin subunit
MNGHDCTGCPSRRDFLRETAAAVTAVSVLLGLDSARAAALPVDYLRGEPLNDGALSYPIPAGDGAVIDRDNEVIIVRAQRKAYAFALSCPHQRTMLKWQADQNRFQCPKHKSRYQPDGKFISGRATRGMDRHAIRLQKGQMIVDRSIVYREDKEPAQWSKAAVSI